MGTVYSTKQFHLWPFVGFFRWRGFYPTYAVTVDNDSVILERDGNKIHSFQSSEIEACTLSKTWFGLGKLKMALFYKSSNYEKDKRGDQWYFFINEFTYVNKEDKDKLISAFKRAEVKCFNSKSVSLRDDMLRMSNEYIVEYDGDSKDSFWALSIPEIKYYYTQNSIIPFRKPILITGADHSLRIKKLSHYDVEALKQHLIDNGARLGEISNKTFHDAWYLSVLFNPKQWFTHVSVGMGDEGITYSQKTFKTNDNIFLPYDKVNFAISKKKWFWFFTRRLIIFGEQNIIPKRRLYAGDAKRIVEELREKGVSEFEGESFSESYHTSGWGVLLSILTIGIWHILVMLFSKKRKAIMVGEKKLAWDGKVWVINFDNYCREKPKNKLHFYAGNVSDVRAVCYRKKHWYHLWGHLYIWVHPSNIRAIAYEASQYEQDYDLEMGKIFSGTYNRILSALENAGFEEDSELNNIYKKWIRHLEAKK